MSGLKNGLSSNEKATIGILLGVILAFAGFWACGAIQKINADSQAQSLQQENRTAFSMNQTMHLSVEEDALAVDQSGNVFEACFPWSTGATDVTINSATLYDDPRVAGVSKDDITFASALEKPFLLITATFKNIDAQPELIDDEESMGEVKSLCDICFLNIPSGELCYFDGVSPKADENSRFDFELGTGEEKNSSFWVIAYMKKINSTMCWMLE